jgi:L-lactate dehydrogenase complex protein LldE
MNFRADKPSVPPQRDEKNIPQQRDRKSSSPGIDSRASFNRSQNAISPFPLSKCFSYFVYYNLQSAIFILQFAIMMTAAVPPGSDIALFIPCYTEQVFPDTGMALARLLRYFGLNPVYVPHQTCCGQPAFNTGYRQETLPLAERFLALFEPYDWIVAPSGSCVTMVKIFYGELALSDLGRTRWERVKNNLFEAVQFIYHQLGIREIGGTFPARVALHKSCHALRELGVDGEVSELLSSIKELELLIPPGAEECCGFGGTFSIKFPELSSAIGLDKIEAVRRTGAQFLTAVDDSCLMHLNGLIRRRGFDLRTLHALRIMAQALKL